jgi:hypothetical protein
VMKRGHAQVKYAYTDSILLQTFTIPAAESCRDGMGLVPVH